MKFKFYPEVCKKEKFDYPKSTTLKLPVFKYFGRDYSINKDMYCWKSRKVECFAI